MKPPRFRLRTLMLGIVLVAVALWVGLLARRSAAYRAISVKHAWEAASLVDCVGYPEPGGIVRRRADHHARLRDKYLRASRRPWLILDDDPPIPDNLE
jgi:hypothetical protein